jgi:hypothetical protein
MPSALRTGSGAPRFSSPPGEQPTRAIITLTRATGREAAELLELLEGLLERVEQVE